MITLLPLPAINALIEESLDAVLIIDGDSTIRYANAAMAQLTGYPSGELVGQSFNLLIDPELVAEHDGYVQHYVAARRKSSVLGRVREFMVRHRSGEMIPVSMKAVDLGDTDGVRFLGAFMEDQRPRRALEAKQRELLEQLEHQALTDMLTGLPNRRAFQNEARQAMARARRDGAPVTVGVADVDHFKSINDRYGHAAGDQVLQELAEVIRKAARASDVVARTGGEEFSLLFPSATVAQAMRVAERIRAAVQAHEVETPGGNVLRVTLSAGLAQLPMDDSEFDATVAKADEALYRAKHGGRNRVEAA
ncbi:GGDEF domain-containing protein [Pseudoduganella sp. GCM10020061]|uniref:GGDEF domain-containing protein n=1 Tax=Pseudoduganella sp. GCM10020061 TaxID=3317345 RepID=UPI00363D8B88